MRQPIAAIGIAIAALCGTSSASAVTLSNCSTMSAGGVSVEECQEKFGGTYTITNGSGNFIFGFAVSTQNTESRPYAKQQGWSAGYYSEAAWNALWSHGASFDATFGTEDTGAYYFSTGEFPLRDQTTSFGFGFDNGLAFSNFVAFDGNDQVISQSYVAPAVSAPVPEPETYAMLLAGLGVLGAVARRRKGG